MEGQPPTLNAGSARKALLGFFLTGILFSFLGAILPVWGYHRTNEYVTVGTFFLSMNLGVLAGVSAAQKLLARKSIVFSLVLASALASGAFISLAAVPPQSSTLWRMAGVFLVGGAMGLLNTATFHALSPSYLHDPVATVNLSGTFFGLGCLVLAMLVTGTIRAYTVPAILILIAVVPGLFAASYARASFPSQPPLPHPSLRQALSDFKSASAVLLALLLFFQFGNEWAIAGWLPLFLVHRLGVSPATALFMLGFYWFSLLAGRIAALSVLPRVHHGRVLMGSAGAALFGCIVLASTNNLFGAGTGILVVGGGFAFIYPLVVEKIGARFPYYHPGFFNGIFSLAVTGGFLAPWSLGYFARAWGLGTVMILPLIGTCMVFLLLALIGVAARIEKQNGGN